jgi:hypothetical protein
VGSSRGLSRLIADQVLDFGGRCLVALEKTATAKATGGPSTRAARMAQDDNFIGGHGGFAVRTSLWLTILLVALVGLRCAHRSGWQCTVAGP